MFDKRDRYGAGMFEKAIPVVAAERPVGIFSEPIRPSDAFHLFCRSGRNKIEELGAIHGRLPYPADYSPRSASTIKPCPEKRKLPRARTGVLSTKGFKINPWASKELIKKNPQRPHRAGLCFRGKGAPRPDEEKRRTVFRASFGDRGNARLVAYG